MCRVAAERKKLPFNRKTGPDRDSGREAISESESTGQRYRQTQRDCFGTEKKEKHKDNDGSCIHEEQRDQSA